MKKEKKEKKQIEDKTRNDIFAVALAYLQSMDEESFGTKVKLAEKIGIDQDTITNILKCYVQVSDATIIKLYVNTGKIFNLRFLLGQSNIMLAEDVKKEDGGKDNATLAALRDQLNDKERMIAEKDAHITDLHKQLADKDEIIATKDALIKNLQQTVASLRADLSMEKGLSTGTSLSAPAEPEHSRPTV